MALSGGVYRTLKFSYILSQVLCCLLILPGVGAADTSASATETTNPPTGTVSITRLLTSTLAPRSTTEKTTSDNSTTTNDTEVVINSTTKPPTTTTPSVGYSNASLTTGEVVGVVVGVLACGVLLVGLVICVRKYYGPGKSPSAPVSYRKGTNIRADRAPLTTKDKDPSPPPDGTEDQYFFEDDIDKLNRPAPSNRNKKTRHLGQHDAEGASLDGDVTTARDGGDDEDYFYDEIFGDSAFTDEITNASIKELSTPVDEDLPDLIFRDDDDDDDFL